MNRGYDRKKYFELFKIKLKTKEDFVLWLKILKSNHVIGAINIKLTYWRNSKNSLSTSTIQKLVDGFRVYYTHMNYKFFKSLFFGYE